MSGAMAETRLTIATVNNGDMIRMQKLTDDFTKMNGYVVTARAATRLV
jgi:sorbitol/mannitol transport system substrate-binding protein